MKFEDLVKHIKEYESDTFSAEGSEITQEEAEKVAERLIGVWVDENLDGVSIDSVLADIRPEDE